MMVIRASEKCTDSAERDSQAKISTTEERSRSPSPLLASAYETSTSTSITFPMQGVGGHKRKTLSQSNDRKEEANVNALRRSSLKPTTFQAFASPGRANKRKKHSEVENTHSTIALFAKQDIAMNINQMRQGMLRQEDMNAELLYQPEETGLILHPSSWSAAVGSSEVLCTYFYLFQINVLFVYLCMKCEMTITQRTKAAPAYAVFVMVYGNPVPLL